MAASNSNIKEPVMRTLIRFMNAVRKENTEQAAQLLRPHSAVERCCIVEYTSLLIPSSVKTIRSVIQSVYLNNKSASDEDLKEAAESVLWTESYILIYSTVIEYSPLLLAIKQGSADEVRSLLQQLPREEAVRLIINGPDVQLSVLSIANEAKYEEKVTDKIRRNYTLTDEQLTVIISFGLSELIKDAISMPTEFSALLSCLALAAARGSPEIIKLLHEFATSRDNRDFLTRSEYFFAFIGYIIASHSSHQAVVTMTEILLERIPADIIKQKVCIDWLIQCVCGGVSGVEVISLILKHTTWDEEVKNVIISLLINTWNFGTEKPIFAALLEKVPDNELGTFLTMDFDMKNFHFTDLSDWLFDTSKHSLLSAGKSSGAEKYIESCLSSTQLSAIAEYVKSSPNTVTSELLALINSHLSDYCIPDHPRAKLQMYGVVCFNEGQLALERNGAKKEAQTVTKAMQDIGIKTGNPIKNWSTYSLLMGLRKFCEDYRDKCSLAVVCIMTHGKAGLLYSNTSSSDSCQISDIFNILEERLPQVIPKVIPFCYIFYLSYSKIFTKNPYYIEVGGFS